ncbi:MAG: OsmC family protein [Alphaproteobacteria bacterium]
MSDRQQALRDAQAPLKAQYKDRPESAHWTLSARGTLQPAKLACAVDGYNGAIEAGLHPATGGDGTQACSGDMLLQALCACAGVTLTAVATAMGLDVRGGTVNAEGDLDFKGTLGVDRAAPVGFTRIRLNFDVDGTLSDDQRATLLKLTERYCVVAQTIAQGSPVAASLTVNGAAAAAAE